LGRGERKRGGALSNPAVKGGRGNEDHRGPLLNEAAFRKEPRTKWFLSSRLPRVLVKEITAGHGGYRLKKSQSSLQISNKKRTISLKWKEKIRDLGQFSGRKREAKTKS